MEGREILEKFCKNPIGVNYSETKQAISNILKENENLKEENNNYKAAALKNDDLYKEVCNKNKELEEEIEDLKNDLYHDGLAHKYLTLKATSIPKSLIKEKIEELDKRIKSITTEEEYKKDKIYTCKDFNEFITSVLQELLGEEK